MSAADAVAAAQRLQALLQDTALFLSAPGIGGAHAHRLEIRHAGGLARVDPHQMPAVSGFQRAAPDTGREVGHRTSEAAAVASREHIRCRRDCGLAEQKGIAKRGRRRVWRRLQHGQRSLRCGARIAGQAVAAVEHLTETQARRWCVARGMDVDVVA